jgi:hypothetical protein
MKLAWKLLASATWVELMALQPKNGAAVASSGVHARGEIWADFALAVFSPLDGSFEEQPPELNATEQTAAAAKPLNHFFETMMRSS